jgi:hypothetical protein
MVESEAPGSDPHAGQPVRADGGRCCCEGAADATKPTVEADQISEDGIRRLSSGIFR